LCASLVFRSARLQVEYIEKLKQMEEKHQHDVQEMETGYQGQIMELVDAYQKLQRERDAQVERLETQRKHLIYAHEQYVEDLAQDFEAKLRHEVHFIFSTAVDLGVATLATKSLDLRDSHP
jgi:Skp family chaperone for outer membrane proteins